MKRPWMPLYVADYRAKTTHLGALEHGIYILLIMHYWQEGSLPNDDRLLARIACATDAEWRRTKPLIEAFFEPGWKHGRIEDELAKAADITLKRRASAEQMHVNRHAIADAKAHAKASHTSHFTHHQEKETKTFSNVGKPKANGWSPPRHGATGKGRVYIESGSQEWRQYAEDWRNVHGTDPTANEHGGKWFKTLGEKSA